MSFRSRQTIRSFARCRDEPARIYPHTRSAYLRPNLESLPQIDAKINSLLSLAADNPRQTNVLNQRIKPLVSSKKEELQSVLEQSHQKGMAGTISSIKNKLRMNIADVTRHDEELLEKRNSHLQKIYVINDTIHYASFVLICVISGLALKNVAGQGKEEQRIARRFA